MKTKHLFRNINDVVLLLHKTSGAPRIFKRGGMQTLSLFDEKFFQVFNILIFVAKIWGSIKKDFYLESVFDFSY